MNTKNIANDEINKKLLDEVLRLYESYKENNKTVEKEEVQVYVPSQRDRMLSWSSLGETILQAYDEITNHEKHIVSNHTVKYSFSFFASNYFWFSEFTYAY